jgi:hypothetical protein
MKLLLLDSSYRRWLNLKSALALNGNLDEKFIGLTHDESIFFAEVSNSPLAPFELWDEEVLKRFLRLHERHELTLAFRRAAHSFDAEY